MSQNDNKKKKKQEAALKKQKQQKKIAIMLIVVVILACIGGGAYMVYENYKEEQAIKEEIKKSKDATNETTVNVDPLLEYLSGVDTELINEEITPDNTAATNEAVSPASVQ